MDSCWVCDNDTLSLARLGNTGALNANQFRITDANYGITHNIYKCSTCDFLQCADLSDVTQYYETMSDEEYDETSGPRTMQARKMIKLTKRMQIKFNVPGNTLLDIGAGAGLLVSEANKLGYDAVGIDPSRPLCNIAKNNNITVHPGVLPNEKLNHSFDVITLIDVIEHVIEPLTLLEEVKKVLKTGGLAVIVTPDVKSLMAKLLGWKWWHFRVAHVGYFNKRNLIQLIERAGFEVCNVSRPTWYLPMDYLAQRLISYISPELSRFVPSILSNITVPLNLFDSLTIVVKKK